MVKLDDPRDIQQAYDDLGNPAAKELHDAETDSISPAATAAIDQLEAMNRDHANKDLGVVARNKELTDGKWADNTSKQAPKDFGNSKNAGSAANKTKAFFKKNAATMTIVTVLGGAAAVPFLGSATLPFAILGNQDVKSMLHGLQSYTEDYSGFRIFGPNKESVRNGTGGKLAGLSKTEIEQLKANDVEFRGGKTNSITKRTTFTAVRVKDGEWIKAGSAFNKEMKANVVFRKAMVFNKGSYWKSAKSAAAANVRTRLGINPNPDLEGDTNEEKNKKLRAAATGDTSSDVGSRVAAADDDVDEDTLKSKNSEVSSIAEGLQEEIEAQKELIAEGEVPKSIAADSNKANIGVQFDKPITEVGAKNVAGQMFDLISPMSGLDAICTGYQAANTAAIVAKGVALANVVRFAMTIRASLEKTKAGDDKTGIANYLMDMVNKADPETNQKFDSSAYASILFNGKLSSEPSAVSVYGGQSLIAIIMGLHTLHDIVGSAAGGNAATGRSILKTGCNVATNIGVQIAATVGSVVLGALSGGSSVVGSTTVNAGVKAGIKKAKDELVKFMVEKFGKEALQKLAANISEQGALKFFSRSAWGGFKTMWKTMGPWDKLGLLIAGVATFGMDSIVDTLSGANVAGYTQNGFAAFDALGTGWNQYEFVNGVANGGAIGTYAGVNAYKSTQDEYEQRYIADMKYEAKDTPLDITNPYSTLGAAVFGAQKMVGLSASTNLFSSIRSVATLPFKLPGLTASAGDGDATPEAIGEQIGDPYMIENQIAQTVTGSPQVIFEKTITFEDFIEKFIDNSTPQVTYDGDDETTGEPKFTIIPGSQLAEYQEECRNPARTEVDQQFVYDDNSNFYDIEKCTKNRNAGFDDAIRFINQVSPDVTSSSTSTTDTTGAIVDVGPNASGAQTPWGGYKNGEIPESAMTKIPIADACSTGYGANSPLRAYLHPKATISVIELNTRYKAKFGRDMYFKGCYRPLSEQQRAWDNEPPGNAATPGTSNHGWGLAIDFAISASQSMTYGSEEYKWLMDNAYKVGWVNPPSMRQGGSGPHEPWHWEYAGSTSTASSL